VGWYSVGSTPTAQDVAIHAQVVASDAGPGVFVLFNPDIPEDAQALPFTVYESALTEGADGDGKFVQLEVGGDGDTSGRELQLRHLWSCELTHRARGRQLDHAAQRHCHAVQPYRRACQVHLGRY
jgi:hypothetical protein